MLGWLRKWMGGKPASEKASLSHGRPAVTESPAEEPESGSPCDPNSPISVGLERDYFALLMGVDSMVNRPLIKLEREALETLIELVKDSHSLSSQVPRLPTLLPKLMHSLHDPNKSGRQLAELIRSDPVTVAEVLRTANSPYYRTHSKIRDIEHAIMVLGSSGLRETVARIALRPVVQFDAGLYNQTFAPRIWEQANKCASACSLLASALRVDRFDAFLAGLMHNVGAAVAFRIMNRLMGKTPPPAGEHFRQMLTVVTPRLTYRVAREWALPETVVAGLHPKDTSSPLGQVVLTAARLAKLHTLVVAERYLPERYAEPWICVPRLRRHQAGCIEELDRVLHLVGNAG